MDFKELLLEADRKHQEAVKQSQQIKRINTNFTTPASREQKSSGPRSEAIQKLLDEKKKEERQRREAEEREKRRKEKARQEREREEKRKNTFRIPKKVASEDPPSDPESFSSISSGDESKLSNNTTAKHHDVPKSSSVRADSEKSHKSSSHGHSEKKDKHSHKTSEHSSSSSNHSSKHRSSEHSSRDQNRHHSETDKTKQHTDKHRHSSNKPDHSQHRSETDKTKHHTDKHRHSSEKQESGSSKTRNSSEKDKSHGSTSNSHSNRSHKHSQKEQNHKHIIKDKVLTFTENDTSGYITSPDISSEEEEDFPESTSKPSSANTDAHHSGTKSRTNSTEVREEKVSAPVELTRHHLKPTKDRTGGSLEERAKILERLQAIRERMAENESGPGRKRAAWGEVKKRRAKREKLDGDFSGSCMEKINYDEEEKPSLKRPEPKPEETKEKVSKENKKRSREKLEKVKEKRKVGSEKREIKGSGKFNRFDEMHEKSEKPPVKCKPRPRPPPVNFADLMKMAEQKQAEPVMVEVAPKEKERRPLTQEELDRKRAREERLKTKDYKDWYKFGNTTNAKQGKPEKTDPDSGGFLRPNHNVVPPENGASQSKPFSIPRKNENAGSAKTEKYSAIPSHPSASQISTSRSAPVPKSRPHPTRPGMIANKPQAMAQHMNSERKTDARLGGEEKQKAATSSSRDTSSQPRPVTSAGASVDKTKGGNAWDRLFSQPEYQKMTQSSASKKRKLVIDSEEDEYDEEMDDFIDDEEEEDHGSVSSIIQKMFGYNRKKFRDEDEDDRDMEVGFCQVMKEEARSARIGKKEDLEDIRREQEELKRKAERKKMRK